MIRGSIYKICNNTFQVKPFHLTGSVALLVSVLLLVSCSGGLVVQSDAKLSALPGGGTYKSAQKIELIASKDVAIYYSVDGSDPYDNPSARLYDPKVGVIIGEGEVNSVVDLKFYSVQKNADGKLGYMSNKIYQERYAILVDEIPPVTKPGINTGIFSKNFDLTLNSTEEASTYYCSVEQFMSDECSVSSCLPDKIYLTGQKLDLIKDSVPLKDLAGQETTKICLVYQSMDRSQNKGTIMNYEYVHSYNSPDISSLVLQSNIIALDGFTQLQFKSIDIKESNITSKLDALEKAENALNLGTDVNISPSDSSASKPMSEGDILVEKRKLTPLKLEVRISAIPLENINEVLTSLVSETSSSANRVNLSTLLSPFGRSALGEPLDFVQSAAAQAFNGFTVAVTSPFVDLRILGTDLVPGNQQIISQGDNQFYLFLVDTSVIPPKFSYFNSTLTQKEDASNKIMLRSTQGSNVVMSSDNNYRLIGNTLSSQSSFEMLPLEEP